MRVLLDTNVILDTMLQRAPWHVDADAILHAAAQGQVTCVSTPLTLATVFYVGRQAVGAAATRVAIRKFLLALSIIPIDRQTLLDADALPGSDFEDNILIAASVTASLDAIVTRNISDFSYAPMTVWQPAELLKRLASGPGVAGANPASGQP